MSAANVNERLPVPAEGAAYRPLTALERFRAAVAQDVAAAVADGYSAKKAIAMVLQNARWPDGRKRDDPPAVTSVRNWYRQWRAGEPIRDQRAAGGRATAALLTRKWDRFAAEHGIATAAREEIAGRTREAIAGEIARGSSLRDTMANIAPDLRGWTAAAIQGAHPDKAALRAACKVTKHLVESFQREQLHAIRSRDAERWSGEFVPRIRRTRDHLRPMQWVAGDVHHLDLVFRRKDGKVVCPNLIAWQDLATNRVFYTVHVLAPRQAIKQADVIESLLAMCAAEGWGAPENLYLDNGSEYLALDLAQDMLELAAVAQRPIQAHDRETARERVVRSVPFQPQGKIIEGFFPNLERHLQAVPGYIAGDRMHKRTSEVGKPPVPYSGGEAAFQQILADTALNYNDTPQQGHLAGRSPFQALQDAVESDGWQAALVDRVQGELAFAKELTRQVDRGRIKYAPVTGEGSVYYYADALLHRTGETVNVRVPHVRDVEYVYVEVATEEWQPVLPEPVYRQGDGAGVAEQRRRAQVLAERMDAARARIPERPPIEEVVARRAAEVEVPTVPGKVIDIGYRSRPAEPLAAPARSADVKSAARFDVQAAAGDACSDLAEAMALFHSIFEYGLAPDHRQKVVARLEADGLRRAAVVELAQRMAAAFLAADQEAAG